jgi:hypothetical protein
MVGSAWENLGALITATAAGVAWGAYQAMQWGDLGMSSGVMLFGLLIAYLGFRGRMNAQVEEKRLEVMLEELRAPRRSLVSSSGHRDPSSHD